VLAALAEVLRVVIPMLNKLAIRSLAPAGQKDSA